MKVRAAGEGIRSSKETAWYMDDFEVKISEVEQPLCLTAVEILSLTEVRQVLMVHKDLDGKGGAMEIVPPGLQGADDGEEFSVVDVIIAFCWDEQLREIQAGMPIAVGVSLEEDGAGGVL